MGEVPLWGLGLTARVRVDAHAVAVREHIVERKGETRAVHEVLPSRQFRL